MDTPQSKQAPVRQLHQGEGTKQWTLLSQSKLLSEYSNFIKEKVLSNENLAYCQHFKEIVQEVHDVIKADRERDYSLHIDAFCKAMTYAAFDRINYFRWGSVTSSSQPTTAPEVHACYQKGSFSVKERPGRYIAVARDQKLENPSPFHSKTQTLSLVMPQKSPSLLYNRI